jgi:cytochrome d ubiquinol oxidase subunit II
MFEALSYLQLQQYWWIIISVLGSILVFLMFVQGGQTLVGQIAKNDTQKTMLINSIGRKWDLGFTTLVTFGGAFFASFPLFYATSFGGAYWVWIIILFSFIIQAISYEYRKKPGNFLGEKTYTTFLFINGLLGTILLGTVVATFFTGSEFSVDKIRLTALTNNAITRWETATHGLEAIANVQNILLGLAVFFLARVLGSLYFIDTINDEDVFKGSRKQVIYNSIPFLVFFIAFMVLLLTKQGYALDPQSKEIFMESNKYFHNYLEMPLVATLLIIGVVGVLTGIGVTIFKHSKKGLWFAGFGTFLTVFSLFCVAGLNQTAYYPSTFDVQSSLTIQNSSSSRYTLTVMSYVSLIVPFVIAYIWYAWRSMNKKPIDKDEVDAEGGHMY